MSLVALLKPAGKNGFGYGSTAEDVTEGISLAGKTIVVTGCNSGLGLETLRVLTKRGARVIGTARDLTKAQAACDSVASGSTGSTVAVAMELADPQSVRAAVATIRADGALLDAVICNAGIMALPKLEKAYGLDLQFFTNHIGHFMFVTGLLDRLADTGRVVMLSSSAHNMAPKEGIQFDNLDGSKGYTSWGNYGQSKFANLLFASELARRFTGTLKTANAVHPGVISTNLGRHMSPLARLSMKIGGPLFLKTIPQGAATQCYVAVHPDAATVSGAYFADCNEATPRKDATSRALAERLWTESEAIVARLP